MSRRHRRSVFLSRFRWCCVEFTYSNKSNSKPCGRRLYTSNHLSLSVVNAYVVNGCKLSKIHIKTIFSLYCFILAVCLFFLSTFVFAPRPPPRLCPMDPAGPSPRHPGLPPHPLSKFLAAPLPVSIRVCLSGFNSRCGTFTSVCGQPPVNSLWPSLGRRNEYQPEGNVSCG